MPENLQPLSLQEAAAEFSKTPQTNRIDDRGFRVEPDGADDSDGYKEPKKFTSLVGDDDVGSAETPTTDDDGQDDEGVEAAEGEEEVSDSSEEAQPAHSTIDPPKSFTSEEQIEFRKLPPEVQQTLVRRESERDRAFHQKLNQVAEEKQGLQPLAQRLAQEQQNFMNLSTLVAQMGMPEAKEFDGVDWVALSRQLDPAAYSEKRARYEQFHQKLSYLATQAQQVQQQQQQQYAQAYQAKVSEQYERLLDDMPELRDKSKQAELAGHITSTMKDYGFSPEELDAVVDSRVIKVMADLAKLKGAEKTRASAMQKRSAQPAPRVMQPGAQGTREQNKGVKLKQAMEKLNKSGDIWDAVNVMNLR